jgi:VanZ family protein
MKTLVVLRVVFWLTVLGVVVLSLLPAPQLPKLAMSVWDKAQHTLAYAALGTLGLWAYAKAWGRMLLGLLAMGIGVELAQATTGWRHGDWQDALANTLGLALAWAAWRPWQRHG